jgi:hypothetical protein
MTKVLNEVARPRGREDSTLVRSSREGTYWQAADGLVVRVAAGEAREEAEAAQRALFLLACREAEGA